jgi:SAM-dependent methyltransferase
MKMKIKRTLERILYSSIDKIYLGWDKKLIERTRNLRLIPYSTNRHGGKVSYGEWCHVIGIFQTLLYLHLNHKTGNRILDIGCGTGLVGIVSEPYVQGGGNYIGIDVRRADIDFCTKHYTESYFLFQHLNVSNSKYAPDQPIVRQAWNIASASIDMVTALSVWTHFKAEDSVFYFREIDRVLKPGGKAIVTFFFLDDHYYGSLEHRSDRPGAFHSTCQDLWIFDVPCSDSQHWFHPRWAKRPEDAIGVTLAGIGRMLEGTSLELQKVYAGNWKEMPGVFFQDVLVFCKLAGKVEGESTS